MLYPILKKLGTYIVENIKVDSCPVFMYHPYHLCWIRKVFSVCFAHCRSCCMWVQCEVLLHEYDHWNSWLPLWGGCSRL